MDLNIALLPGDGIGPEVIQQAVKVLQAVEESFKHNFTFKEGLIGAAALAKFNTPLPKQTIALCESADCVLFGAIGAPEYDRNPNITIRPEDGLLQLRKTLGLFANIRPLTIFDALIDRSPLKRSAIIGTDFVIFRELTGGIYFGEKWENSTGTIASDLCEYSEKEISRITHLAFKAAKNRNNKLTLVDKSNVLQTSRLWRKVVANIAKSYPEVTLDYLYVDNAAMQLILNPKQFDVILTENMFGDILSDEASVISGSIGLLPSASIGEDKALFEPIHGAHHEAKDKDIANPIGAILSAAMLLEHFKLYEESLLIRIAVTKSLEQGIVTSDLKDNSNYGTQDVGDFITEQIFDLDSNFEINNENIDLGKSTII